MLVVVSIGGGVLGNGGTCVVIGKCSNLVGVLFADDDFVAIFFQFIVVGGIS